MPGENLYAYKDQQREVNFFLGFSHEGLRAWDAQPGRAETPNVFAPPKLAQPEPPARQTGAPIKHLPNPQATTSTSEFRVVAQQRLLAIVQNAPGARMRISDLGQSLERAFPKVNEKIPAKAGFGNLTQMVQANSDLRLAGDVVLVALKK